MERIISEIKNTADKVAKKSTELFELSKVKLNIANTKSDIDNNYKILGKLLYCSQKEVEEVTPEKFEEIISEIDALQEKLAELNEYSANLSNKKICPDCKKANDGKATFCSHCGYNFID